MISKVWHHFCIKKIKSNTSVQSDFQQCAIIGHNILFDHDAPQQTTFALDSFDSIDDSVKLHFVGTENEIDTLMQATLGTPIVRGCTFVLYQHLSVLCILNPNYWKDKPLDLSYLQHHMEAIEDHLMSTAFVTINKAVVEQENAIGDDVTQVQTTVVRGESWHSPLMDLTGASVLDMDWYGGLATIYENDGGSDDKEGDCGRMDDGVDDVDPPELVMIKGPVDVKPCDPGNILGKPVDDDNIKEVYGDFAGDVDKSGAVMIGTTGMEHGCDCWDAASEPSDHEFASHGMEALMDEVDWHESVMI